MRQPWYKITTYCRNKRVCFSFKYERTRNTHTTLCCLIFQISNLNHFTSVLFPPKSLIFTLASILSQIIHRNLAARNVLVGQKETYKVTDFGMARDVQQENIYERKTKVINNNNNWYLNRVTPSVTRLVSTGALCNIK